MDDNLAAQVRQPMRERDTESLLQIWRRADGEGWSDEAYEIVRQTLVERGVVPPAVPAVRAPSTVEDEEDVYHSFGRLMSVAGWAATLSWLLPQRPRSPSCCCCSTAPVSLGRGV